MTFVRYVQKSYFIHQTFTLNSSIRGRITQDYIGR